MPPKPKYTKEEIILATYDLAKEKGIEAVTAREVGKKLNTSSTPIFTYFENMEDLKIEVRSLGKKNCYGYVMDCFEYTPAFKAFGMKWIEFAIKEPNIYSLLFMDMNKNESSIVELKREFSDLFKKLTTEITYAFQIPEEEAEGIFDQLLIHSHGLATLAVINSDEYDVELISASISQVCLSLVFAAKLRCGTFNEAQAVQMAKSAKSGIKVQKK